MFHAAIVAQSALAATIGWDQTTPETYSYTNTANWVGMTINDTFDSWLVLTDNMVTGSQALTFGANYATAGALVFAYDDANTAAIPYNFTLVSDGTADRTLTLGGNLTFSPVKNTRLLTIGSATADEGLALNLGGATRTFDVTTVGGTGSDPGGGVTLLNAVTNGAITKTGTGWLRIGGTEANTLSGLTVSQGVVRLQKTDGINAVAGDILINGGALFLGVSNQIADTASVTITSGSFHFAPLNAIGSSNTPKSETFKNLTISGGTLNTSPKGQGSGASATDTITGTMEVSGGTISIRNGGAFNVNRLEATGSTVAVSTITSSSQKTTTLVIGAGGLEITNNAADVAYNAVSINNWAKFTLGGDVVFNGNGTNSQTSAINAATNLAGGATDLRTFSLNGGTRTFTIGNGAADVDLLLDADFTITNGATGTGGITKAGLGTLQIDSTGTYTGDTTVNAGTLVINGNISTSTAVVNNTGILSIASGGVTGAVNVNSGGVLDGIGTTGALTINSGGTVSPGNSPGTLSAGNTTFGSNGNYRLELRNDGTGGAGNAGTEWDKLGITGTLDISGLSEISTFVLTLQTLTALSSDGALGSWDPDSNHTWESFLTTTGGLVGIFDPNLFSINTDGFVNPLNGTFSVAQNGTNLDLVYLTVPEPSAFLLILSGAGMFIVRRRRTAF